MNRNSFSEAVAFGVALGDRERLFVDIRGEHAQIRKVLWRSRGRIPHG